MISTPVNTQYTNPKVDSRFAYLSVPFSRKDYAKANGCRWSTKYRLWYVLKQNINYATLVKEFPYKPYEVVYLRVPYGDKEDAKRLGAKWDKVSKLWFSPYGKAGFERWLNTEDVLTEDDESALESDDSHLYPADDVSKETKTRDVKFKQKGHHQVAYTVEDSKVDSLIEESNIRVSTVVSPTTRVHKPDDSGVEVQISQPKQRKPRQPRKPKTSTNKALEAVADLLDS